MFNPSPFLSLPASASHWCKLPKCHGILEMWSKFSPADIQKLLPSSLWKGRRVGARKGWRGINMDASSSNVAFFLHVFVCACAGTRWLGFCVQSLTFLSAHPRIWVSNHQSESIFWQKEAELSCCCCWDAGRHTCLVSRCLGHCCYI